MTAEKPPIRITKQRAQAFLEIADLGIDSERDSIEQAFGVKVRRDGELEAAGLEKFELLEPVDRADLQPRIDALVRAVDTLAILRRRYG